MSEKINDGGPAFPRDHAADGHNGMTLRDYFAAHAPPPPVGWRMRDAPRGFHLGVEDIVDWHWYYADCMLAKRSKS